MLNYVWLALLFLGLGAALTTDLVNQSKDKYKNNQRLPVTVEFLTPFDKSKDKVYEAKLKIKASDFNNFYKEDIKNDFTFPAKIFRDRTKGENKIYFKVTESDPEIWKEMSKVSGDEDDLTGKIHLENFSSGTLAEGYIILEEISFLRMKEVTNSVIDNAKIAVSIALGLIGIMALWLGVMKVADDAGLIKIIARWIRPLTKKIFPEVPPDHPAVGSMVMNISANLLGLGNAATPFGLKAMEELDKLNTNKGTATNAMVTFLAINTAGLTLIPASAIAIRAASGSSDPAIIIGTSLFGSFCATITGIFAAKTLEKFPIPKGEFKAWLLKNMRGTLIFLAILLISLIIIFAGGKFLGPLINITPELFRGIVQVISTIAIPLLIFIFIGYGAIKKVKVYEQFVEGAKEGFNIAVRIIPFLVAMLMAIGIFRAGGAMDWLGIVLKPFTDFIGMPAEALPMALMRPLSSSGSLGLMAEIFSVYGPDSFIGVLVSTFYGSTETTFYVLAVYFGAVNIKNARHALPAGLIADLAGMLGALFIVKLMFGY
jgi:spore maturation protein SpmA